mmetsp:Transcript_14484/g.60433  ORF Transcript_14484/g.60433 Transcript_14484/m.60433 type:complete len:174 (+) Transcript_14484:2231-2752(+)
MTTWPPTLRVRKLRCWTRNSRRAPRRPLRRPRVCPAGVHGLAPRRARGRRKRRRRLPKKAAKARREAEAKRRDAGKSHVIISEKYDKKAATLTARQVPFGFGSREVYEASLRQPLGREFNSDRTYRDLNRPKLLTTAGAVIAAPKKPTATGGGAGGSGRAKGSAGKRKPLGVK